MVFFSSQRLQVSPTFILLLFPILTCTGFILLLKVLKTHCFEINKAKYLNIEKLQDPLKLKHILFRPTKFFFSLR
ncbi:unnamed protein product [Callosobruchus maculatus]|uniref:Uncharacterized protein n=1 Tax=Callosobruchus maculatus TaxID=64391 RepID=A0A653DSR1_CALMS|nr:unnamed protein product [Callosobruchus maculatus]